MVGILRIKCLIEVKRAHSYNYLPSDTTVNAVISKRFAKRQQMQWTKRGAHLLLQMLTRALDGTLRPQFDRWYPGLANNNSPICSALRPENTPHIVMLSVRWLHEALNSGEPTQENS
jgi:hypothetical protein